MDNDIRERVEALLFMMLVPFNFYGQWVALGFFVILVVLCIAGFVL